MRIFPAIDIIGGKCVRLVQGDYAQKKVYNEDPLAVARTFEQAGLTALHLVDLDGAKAGKVINWQIVELITQGTSLAVDFGGGIKTESEIQRLLEIGVRQINLGSIAVKDQATVNGWIKKFGPEKIILSADVNNERVAIHGWQSDSGIDLTTFVQGYVDHGIVYITCTDIQTDGMLRGPNVALYRKLIRTFPGLNIIASGGVSCKEDLIALQEAGLYGAIVGKAIYEERVTLVDLVNI